MRSCLGCCILTGVLHSSILGKYLHSTDEIYFNNMKSTMDYLARGKISTEHSVRNYCGQFQLECKTNLSKDEFLTILNSEVQSGYLLNEISSFVRDPREDKDRVFKQIAVVERNVSGTFVVGLKAIKNQYAIYFDRENFGIFRKSIKRLFILHSVVGYFFLGWVYILLGLAYEHYRKRLLSKA